MTDEAPFFLSIAALSASLAGLAGLVAALRRGEGLAANDRFRLHEIVEFSFANIIVAISIIPLTSLTGSVETALRIGGAAVFAYVVANVLLLTRRARRMAIQLNEEWVVVVAVLNLAALVLAGATVVSGSVGSFQALLVVLLSRPMIAFLFVLSSFEAGGERRPD